MIGTDLMFLIFVLNTTFLMIIFLTMIIAILEDTYDRVTLLII